MKRFEDLLNEFAEQERLKLGLSKEEYFKLTSREEESDDYLNQAEELLKILQTE